MIQTGDPERSLPELIDSYLTGLPAPARDVLAYLSVQEPLDRPDLVALTSADAIDAAESLGAVQQIGAAIYSGHPLFTEHTAANTAEALARQLRTAVADRLAGHPFRHLGDRLGRSVLALDSERPESVDDVVAAAQEALRLGDLGLSERLAAAALERDERFDARLALSYALAWQGRGREADHVLAEVDPGTLSEEQVLAWALPRAANQFWMLSEPERATAFLQTVRRRVSGPPARITLDALSATFAMNAGNVDARTGDRDRGAGGGRCPGYGGGVGIECGRAELRSDGTIFRRRPTWCSGRWAPSIPDCCASPSDSPRPPPC